MEALRFAVGKGEARCCWHFVSCVLQRNSILQVPPGLRFRFARNIALEDIHQLNHDHREGSRRGPQETLQDHPGTSRRWEATALVFGFAIQWLGGS